MKNRITTALAITITALGLASLPSLASAENYRHRDGTFNSFQERDSDRHHRRHNDDRHHNHRHHNRHHNHRHHYDWHHVHSRHCGHGPQHGYYREGYHSHGSHIGLSGYYVDPMLGIRVVIH